MIDLGITSALLDGNGHEASITIVNALVYKTDATTVSTSNASTNHPIGERRRQRKNLACNRAAARSSLTCAMADTVLLCMSIATSVYMH